VARAVAKDGDGLSLTEFAAAMARALRAYDCADTWSVATTPVTDADAATAELRAALIATENGKTGSPPPIFISTCSMATGSIDVYKKDDEPMWPRGRTSPG
jgi:hypothetical protein